MIEQRPLPYPLDPLKLFEQLRALGEPVLLDSGQPESLKRFGRFDILSAAPEKLIRYNQSGLQVRDQQLWCSVAADPFNYLATLLAPLDSTVNDLPFTGGLIGHWAYDLGRVTELLPTQAEADIDLPWMQVGLYLWAIVIDHQKQESWLVSQPGVHKHLLKQLARFVDRVDKLAKTEKEAPFKLTDQWRANMTETEYSARLDRVADYIRAGDCYQINFAQRFQTTYEGDCWSAYLKVRKRAPTPFSAYLESDVGTLMSFSPERFVQVDENGLVETRPIKGTRPRGHSEEADRSLAEELKHATKDRAENLMIVDLLRNDLSRVSVPGSVKVPEIFEIETYPNVHHLVSAITSKLDPSQTSLDLLRSAFPGGSITGAPKIRAMEIIDELEPQRRSAYCGSIGYISASGRMDTNICIRTLICVDNQIYCWAGGGIVADSNTNEEYQETLNKVGNLLSALSD